MIYIKNNGQDVVETNFWESELAESGTKYLSWSEGTARLLVPDSIKLEVNKMLNMKFVSISKINLGEFQALDLYFDNHYLIPYKILLFKDSYENFMSIFNDDIKFFDFGVWTSEGLQVTLQGMLMHINDEPVTRSLPIPIPARIQMQKRDGYPLFLLGKIETTEDVMALLNRIGIDITELLQRHLRGDWGCVPYSISDDNEQVIREKEGEILSYYRIRDAESEFEFYSKLVEVKTKINGCALTTILFID